MRLVAVRPVQYEVQTPDMSRKSLAHSFLPRCYRQHPQPLLRFASLLLYFDFVFYFSLLIIIIILFSIIIIALRWRFTVMFIHLLWFYQ